jgi:hypothetical protein
MHRNGFSDATLGPHLVDVKTLGIGDESAGANNIEGGDTEETVRVVHAGRLEDLYSTPRLAQLCSSDKREKERGPQRRWGQWN